MDSKNAKMDSGYTLGAIVMHWATVALIIAAFAIAHYIEDMEVSPVKLRLMSYHKWTGVSVVLLGAARVLWRLLHPPPEFPVGMGRIERVGARAAHLALYVLIFVVPVFGWLASSAHGFQTVYFGIIPIPDILPKDKALAKTLGMVHTGLVKALVLIAALHAFAALKHQLYDRDGLLMRMVKPSRAGR